MVLEAHDFFLQNLDVRGEVIRLSIRMLFLVLGLDLFNF
jgi:hypothetical protein